MQKLLHAMMRGVSAVAIVLLFLSYLAPWVRPDLFPWLSFFGTGYPWWLLFNVVLLLYWAWRMGRFALYHIGIIAFGWSYVTAFWGLNSDQKVHDPHFVVMTHNQGGLFKRRPDDKAVAEVAERYVAFLKERGVPDVICSQETYGPFYREVARRLGFEYSFNLKKGTVIISRFPIAAGGDIPFGKTQNSTLWADIKGPQGKTFRVYNVHLQSNKVSAKTEKMLEPGEIDQDKAFEEIGFVLNRVGAATAVRTEQAERIRLHQNDCPHPSLICGDFNDTPNSWVYRHLSEGMTDAFQTAGFGRGTTYAGSLPMLRIDYVLAAPAIDVYDCTIARNPAFSDHYPVFAVLGGR